MHHRFRLFVVLCALAVAALAAPTRAQFALPRELVGAADLSPAQVTQIDDYIREPLASLGDQDEARVTRARATLLAPLRERNVSFRFRTLYSEKLLPALQRVMRGSSALATVNALRLAGELATIESAALIEPALADERPSVRFAAVSAIERIFGVITTSAPAIPSERAMNLLRTVAGRLAQENDPRVFDAIVRAVIGAMAVDRAGYEALRTEAMALLDSGVGQRIKGMKSFAEAAPFAPAIIRAVQAGRDASTNVQRRLPEAGIKQAAELAGHALALVVRFLPELASAGPELRATAAGIVGVAETTISLAGGALNRQIPGQNMAADVQAGTRDADTAFVRKSASVFVALRDAPFSFPENTFITAAP